MAHILIIDDEELICRMLSALAGDQGHEAHCAQTLEEGLHLARTGRFDVVFLDVHLPDGNGLGALPELRSLPEAPEVIILTGYGDPDGAELAIKHDAWDYLEKKAPPSHVALALQQVLQYRREKLTTPRTLSLKPEGLVGQSRPMRQCLELLAQAAACEANVLICGATGTGKELFARAIHQHSARRHRNFVVVDCAALPENLVESALFGHVKGAFTGADKAVPGLIAQAHGGTLFLDEVGELPASMQKAFLRVLQERSYRPLGAKHEVASDFRLVAATNRNLEEMVHQGTFRRDLFYRLRSLVISLPSLKDRNGDLYELSLYHLHRLCQRQGLEPKAVAPEFFEALAVHDWPGNVRELVQVLDAALARAQNDRILIPQHLPHYLRAKLARVRIQQSRAAESERASGLGQSDIPPPLAEVRQAAVAQVEQQYLRRLLKQTGGNVRNACELSGLSRPRFYALLKKYQLIPSQVIH